MVPTLRYLQGKEVLWLSVAGRKVSEQLRFGKTSDVVLPPSPEVVVDGRMSPGRRGRRDRSGELRQVHPSLGRQRRIRKA